MSPHRFSPSIRTDRAPIGTVLEKFRGQFCESRPTTPEMCAAWSAELQKCPGSHCRASTGDKGAEVCAAGFARVPRADNGGRAVPSVHSPGPDRGRAGAGRHCADRRVRRSFRRCGNAAAGGRARGRAGAVRPDRRSRRPTPRSSPCIALGGAGHRSAASRRCSGAPDGPRSAGGDRNACRRAFRPARPVRAFRAPGLVRAFGTPRPIRYENDRSPCRSVRGSSC
jgi:hypothetical protein